MGRVLKADSYKCRSETTPLNQSPSTESNDRPVMATHPYGFVFSGI